MTWMVVLQKMMMLVILILTGFACAKAQWVDSEFSKKASRLVLNIFMVALIVKSAVNVEPMFSSQELLLAVGAGFLMFGVGAALGWLVSRILPLDRQNRTVAWLSVFFMNNVFIGFPVIEAIFGPDAIFCASLSNLPFNLLLYSVGVAQLRAGQGKGRVKLREVFTAPMIATFVAIALFLLQLPVPELASDTLSTLGGVTVPLSMIIVGISLSRVPIRAAFTDWRAYAVSLTKLVLCPVVTWLILGLFLPPDSLIKGVFVAIAACPSASMITILSVRFGADDTFASRVNFLSTVLCAVTLPIITYFLL